jgi:hypothetical protein
MPIASGETERAGSGAWRVHSISVGWSLLSVFLVGRPGRPGDSAARPNGTGDEARAAHTVAIPHIAEDVIVSVVHEILVLVRLLATRFILNYMPFAKYEPRWRHSSRIVLPLSGAPFAPYGDEFCHTKLR